jgi:hypothetical protein
MLAEDEPLRKRPSVVEINPFLFWFKELDKLTHLLKEVLIVSKLLMHISRLFLGIV